MGRHLCPQYGQVMLVSRYLVLSVVRKDGRSVGQSGYGHVITKFSRMGSLPHFLAHGAPQARFVHHSSAIISFAYLKFVLFPFCPGLPVNMMILDLLVFALSFHS